MATKKRIPLETLKKFRDKMKRNLPKLEEVIRRREKEGKRKH